MSNTVIKVEGLSKRYQLGTIGYGSLQHDLKAWWAKIRGKEDPNTRIGERSRLDLHGDFWALREVGFEVQKGDRVGIIGRNGAGKSTLLKLLSRVTSPTTGSIKVKGRVASLLEVGTGFHPELTGRENVFLNGAILGMHRREIQSKFDEIVDFAGVGQFIDTPVKRYSSGMYVRLAFSVAAHLDSEILIIDEVLAVGDAEFQKKCIGKMEDVSRGQGRTVLFVSHSLPSILQLCNKGILLQGGQILVQGGINDAVWRYKHPDGSDLKGSLHWNNRELDNDCSRIARMESSSIVDENGVVAESPLTADHRHFIVAELQIHEPNDNIGLFVTIYYQGQLLFTSDCQQYPAVFRDLNTKGRKRVLVEIPKEILQNKDYEIEMSLVIHNKGWSLLPDSGQRFHITNVNEKKHPLNFEFNHPFSGGIDPSPLLPPLNWSLEK